MKNIKTSAVAAVVALLALAGQAIAETVTVTNRGQVIQVNIQPVSGGETADETIVKDTSDYATGRGGRGTIVRWLNVAKNGGEAGKSLVFDPPVAVPSNAIVIGGYVEIAERFLPGTNLASIGINAAGTDILAATTNLSSAAGSRLPIVPVWTVGTSVKATNAITAKLITDADNAEYTAGRAALVLDYFLGQ